MSVDTPARIAILGAGPIGLETALYARFLGYDVDIYERGGVAENILAWGHVRMFTPFGQNRSRLGLAALTAQEVGGLPADGDLLTGREYLERYLAPLSRSDLLDGNIHERTEVLAIGRKKQWKGENVGSESRDNDDFQILLRERNKSERTASADVVVDCTGTYGDHNWLGRGGLPAPGEQSARRRIEYRLPDVLGESRHRYAGRRVVVIGAGHSAATTVVALAELAQQEPETRVTWITRGPSDEPIPRIKGDRFPERDHLASAANHVSQAKDARVSHWPETTIREIRWKKDAGVFKLKLGGRHAGKLEADRVIANVGYRPNLDLFRELHVQTCYATEGPMKLASALAAAGDDKPQGAFGPETLLTPEPDFYILGAKSYGRNSQFFLSNGFDQIRALFTILGDRPDLDLYSTVGKLP